MNLFFSNQPQREHFLRRDKGKEIEIRLMKIEFVSLTYRLYLTGLAAPLFL